MKLKESIRIKEAEVDGHISEIETIGQAYEDMQTQNQHLLQQVADRDDFNIKLVSDSVKMKQAYGSLLAEKNMLQKQLQHVNSSLESSKLKITSGEEQMKTYVAQAMKSSSENRHLAISLERTMLEVSDAEKELKWLRSATGSAEKEYEINQKKIAELKMELERERNERIKLEEEYEEVKNEVSELTSETEETTIQKLQDEIKECKAILKCGVCFDRPKEVMGHWATESTYSGLCRFVSEPRCRYLGFNYYLHPSQIHVSLLYSYMRQPILLPPLMAFLFLSLFFLLLLLLLFFLAGRDHQMLPLILLAMYPEEP
jgi:E3 ubiquitin-protein ligase BRE1